MMVPKIAKTVEEHNGNSRSCHIDPSAAQFFARPAKMIAEKSFKSWHGGSWPRKPQGRDGTNNNITVGSSRIFLGTFPYVLGFILFFSLPGTIASSQEQVLVSSKAGECELSVEANEKWHTLRLRAHHPKYRGCHIDKESMLSILHTAFSKDDSPKPEGSYSSLFIGRMIDFPWMSQYLAGSAYHDRRWDSKKGKPVNIDINTYVSQLLFQKELIAEIEAVCAKGGYRVEGVTVEKVLVGGFGEVPLYQGEMHPGRVPYDAQVWFRLGRI